MSAETSGSGGRHPLFWPTLVAVPALAVLLGLGTWQMQRKAWKDGLIAQIATRSASAPVALAAGLEMARAGGDPEYLRVRVEGRFPDGTEWFYWAPGRSGNGWHVYAPFETSDGAILVVNRGFVAHEYRAPAMRPEPTHGAARTLTGLLRKAEPKGAFTPQNDVAKNMWYSRDLAGMVATLPAERAARALPLMLDVEGQNSPPPAPQGGVTRLELPNTHLQYALTWYGLAATLIGVYSAFAWPRFGRARDVRRGGDGAL